MRTSRRFVGGWRKKGLYDRPQQRPHISSVRLVVRLALFRDCRQAWSEKNVLILQRCDNGRVFPSRTISYHPLSLYIYSLLLLLHSLSLSNIRFRSIFSIDFIRDFTRAYRSYLEENMQLLDQCTLRASISAFNNFDRIITGYILCQ